MVFITYCYEQNYIIFIHTQTFIKTKIEAQFALRVSLQTNNNYDDEV